LTDGGPALEPDGLLPTENTAKIPLFITVTPNPMVKKTEYHSITAIVGNPTIDERFINPINVNLKDVESIYSWIFASPRQSITDLNEQIDISQQSLETDIEFPLAGSSIDKAPNDTGFLS
jgi:hypothetical protein